MRYVVLAIIVIGTIVLFAAPWIPELQLGGPYTSAGFVEFLANLTEDQVKYLLSGVLIIASLWVFLSRLYSPHDQHVGYFCLGSVIGYWFKH